MSLLQKLMYDVEGNFTFDSNLIEFVDSKARLKLIDHPEQSFEQIFDDDTDFIYDSSKTEFISGVLRQKDQRPENATFFASYTSSLNGNWGNGVLNATNVGGVLNAGFVEFLGAASTKYIDYPASLNVGASFQVGAVRFIIRPGYSGTPGTAQSFMRMTDDGINRSVVSILHTSGGDLEWRIYDSAGTLISSASLGTWVPVSGTSYEFEINWDFNSGATRLFINGTQMGSTLASTATMGFPDVIRVGDASVVGTPSVYPNFSLGSLLVFSTVQHTANYTPGALISETLYGPDEITLPAFEYDGLGDIQSFDSASIIDSNSPRYILNDKYWNGSSWVTSNGTYSQAVSASTLISQISSFPTSVSNTLVIKIVTQDQNLQSSIDALSILYTGQIYPTSNPSIENNAPISADALVSLAATSEQDGGDSIQYILVVNNQDKYWNGTAWVNSNGSFAQSNTVEDIDDNLEDLDISGGVSIKIKALLHSSDGSSTPELEEISLMYDFFVSTPSQPNKCILYGFLNDHVGLISSSREARLEIELASGFKYGDRIIGPFKRVFEYNANGYVETTNSYLQEDDANATDGIVETESIELSPYFMSIQYRDLQGKLVKVEKQNVQVPDLLTANLADLLFPSA